VWICRSLLHAVPLRPAAVVRRRTFSEPGMPRLRPIESLLLLPIGLLAAAAPMASAVAQEMVSVMVDDSPSAAQRFEQLVAQREGNPAEAARLAAELLDEFGERLIPVEDPAGERFRSVRGAVEAALRRWPDLAARHREREEPLARRLLAEGRLEALAQRRAWTTSGLEAVLRLAQRDLEEGRVASALRRLDRVRGHPDLRGAAAQRAATIETLAGWAAGRVDGATLLAGRAGLDPAAVAALDSIVTEPPPPSRSAASPLEAVPDGDAGIGAWQTFWSLPMPGAAYRRAFEGEDSGRRLPARVAARVAEEGSLLVTMPAADDRTVYLHEGHQVRAIDRLSRRERWSTVLDRLGSDGSASVGDPAMAVVRDGLVVAIGGHALGTLRTGSARIHGLDAADGRILWSTSLADEVDGQVGEAGRGGETIFPYGVPAIDGHHAFVLARRVTNRLETIDYLACLSLADGRLAWIVRLGSCGGIRLGGLRPYSHPRLHEGRVLVVSSVGVVASIDATDGAVEWLRRVPVPLREARYAVEPWECGGAVVIGDSVFAIAPDQQALLRLALEDGRLLDAVRIEPATLRLPRYLIAARDDGEDLLLAVGGDVVALDADDLSRRWSMSEASPELLAGWSGTATRQGLRGRVHLAGDLVVVPSAREVALLAVGDGRVAARIPIDEAGNPLLVDGQLLLATKDAVVSAMPPALAQARLEGRRAADPQNPEWPLALMDLAAASGDLAGAVAAASEALRAVDLDGSPREREGLFARLLDLDREGPVGHPAEAVLRDLLVATAVSPSQRLRERLSRGDWLALRDRPGEAIEAWQSILSEPVVAAEVVPIRDRRVDGVAAATERIRRLAAIAGPRVLEPIEATAALRLDRALADRAGASELLRIAREFPATERARQAYAAAAEVERRAGRTRPALWILLEALQRVPDAEAALLEPLVSLCIDAGWTEIALAALASAAERGGDGAARRRLDRLVAMIPPQRDGAAAAPMRDRAPRLGTMPGEAFLLPGRIVAAPLGGPPRSRTGILLASDGTLTLLAPAGAALEARWSVPIEDAQPQLLRDGEDLLLWQELDWHRPMAMRIDAATGRVQWANPSLDAVLPPTSRPDAAADTDHQRIFPGGTLRPREILPAIVGDLLVLVRRSGDLAAVDLQDGRGVRWSRSGVLEQVWQIDAGPLGVVVAGRGRDAEGKPTVDVVWIDPDGAERRRWTLPAEWGVRWVRLSPEGRVAWGGDGGVELRSVGAGGDASDLGWTLEGPASRVAVEGWLRGDRLLVREGSGRLASRRVFDGGDAVGFEGGMADGDAAAFADLRIDGTGVTLLRRDRLLRFGAEGQLVGMDAVSEDRNFVAMAEVDGGVMVLSARGTRPALDEMNIPRSESAYLVYRFDLEQGGRQVGPALDLRTIGPRLDVVGAIDGWLLLSSPVATIAVPLPE
jgi:outer membrane protein assembly factor BamB